MISIRYIMEYGNYYGKPSKYPVWINDKGCFAHITDVRLSSQKGDSLCKVNGYLLSNAGNANLGAGMQI